MMNEIQISENNIELYIIGEGSIRNEIIEKIKYFGLNKKIFLLGDQSQEFIAKILRTVDLIISPLLEERYLKFIIRNAYYSL